MKKTLLLLFLIPFIYSCSDDEGGIKKTFEKVSLQGDWFFYEVKAKNKEPVPSFSHDPNWRLIFESNGNVTIGDELYRDDILTGTWVFDGEDMIICDVKYENKLLEQSAKTIQYKLIEVSANEIIVEAIYPDEKASQNYYVKYSKDTNAPHNILGYVSENSGFSFSTDAFGVSLWTKEEKLEFVDTYSLIDTLFSERIIEREITYLFNEGDNVTVDWYTNKEIIKVVNEDKLWNSGIQKWSVTSKATIKVTMEQNLTYGVDIIYPNRTVKRFKTIPEINIRKEESDIWGITFGTDKSEIKNLTEYSPTLAYFKNWQVEADYDYYLGFTDGKLVRIYCTLGNENSEQLAAMAGTLKIPEPLNFNRHDEITNPQEWNNGKLKFKAFDVDFSDYIKTGKSVMPCICVEKI